LIRRNAAAGMTYKMIADELNSHGTQTARGGIWHASTVCNVLKRMQALSV
jgi:hypothetical protein